jgi:hypothetical protein
LLTTTWVSRHDKQRGYSSSHHDRRDAFLCLLCGSQHLLGFVLTESHQFLIALLAIIANTLFAVLSWLKSRETYHVVNSRMDEFKRVLEEAAYVAMQKFREELLESAREEHKEGTGA